MRASTYSALATPFWWVIADVALQSGQWGDKSQGEKGQGGEESGAIESQKEEQESKNTDIRADTDTHHRGKQGEKERERVE